MLPRNEGNSRYDGAMPTQKQIENEIDVPAHFIAAANIGILPAALVIAPPHLNNRNPMLD